MDIKVKIQKFGGFLAGMVIPNIGAFIAWGLITAFFIPTGWLPNKELGTMVQPMIRFLLPILIAFTGGKMVYDQRGGVAGAVAAMGAIVGADIPMFMAAMILGPLGAVCIKKIDKFLEGKVKSGFEMLISNFTIGILGMILAIFSFKIIGPIISSATNVAVAGINVFIKAKLLPLLAVIIEPAKVIFLNNAIDQGIFVPLGVQDISQHGQTIFFMLVSSPAPGAGILLAYSIFGKGNSKKSAPSALLIEFIGGIHEVYFPYVLMKPIMFLAVIFGGVAQAFVWNLVGAGLAGYPHPGSIVSFLIMLPKGGFIKVMLGILAGIVGSFSLASFFLKAGNSEEDSEEMGLSDEIGSMLGLEKEDSALFTKDIDTIVFACDAGIGSSAMGAGILRNKIKEVGLDIKVENYAVDKVPKGIKLVVCHKNLYDRARKNLPKAKIRTVESFLNDPVYDILIKELKKGEVE
ncbi:PTS mannitol transporter subunit IICB [Clostridium brassicae]|uniref:PTS system mannitol-specific EIICB component n=1 Tax=Clostridium brassicae TaxID=2999072 RepID=A0ABT4D867_9CLOT|nr:PTS mannitol transporter subunit IICB [Clostridium brassicae]MCY6958495.1 PTS mannitol transporter subunit IICB [Clostridium brassicae]